MRLVTGEKGFCGGNLIKRLDNAIGDNGKELIDVPTVNAVLHQAAISSTVGVSEEDINHSNVEYPMSLFNKLVEKGCKTFVVASSTAVYGDQPGPFFEDMLRKPLNAYARSKVDLEDFCITFANKHQADMTILRYCNVFGPGEAAKGNMASMIYQIAKAIKNRTQPKLFKYGEQRRDWVPVETVCLANINSLKLRGCNIINCGGGITVSFNDIVAIVNHILGEKAEPCYIDNPYDGFYQNHTECNMDKSKSLLGIGVETNLYKKIEDYLMGGI